MTLAIMQPYFLPYIGYFQLLNCVDEFVVYDNIEYTKKGWINRNRIWTNNGDVHITLPLKKDSDYLHVNQRFLSDTWQKEKNKTLNKIKASYTKAPFFKEVYSLAEECINYDKTNLFDFIYYSIEQVKKYLMIKTPIIISSSLHIDKSLKSQDKVLSICKELCAKEYINPIGGYDLYEKDEFAMNGIELKFLKSKPMEYSQFNDKFIPWLSILDVLMFNSRESVIEYINRSYELI